MARRPPVVSRGAGKLVLVAAGGLGVSCVMTQLALMRELLGAFAGNEMVLGVALGLWLLLMGIGAWLGRSSDKLRNPLATLAVIQVLVAVLPLAQVFLLRTLRNVVFIRGAAVGVTETVGATFVLLLPYCVVAGYALTLACAILSRQQGPAGIGRAYVADSIGSIIGGLVFSFVLVNSFDHIAILVYPALLNLLLAALVAWSEGRASTPCAPPASDDGAQQSGRPFPEPRNDRDGPLSLSLSPSKGERVPKAGEGLVHGTDLRPDAVNATHADLLPAVAALLGLGLIAAIIVFDLDALSTRLQYPHQRIVAKANSPYGKLIVTESDGQFDFLENGIPITSTRDDQHVEETVHYAMAQRPEARRVLLVSGGISGTAREILKYGVAVVDYVELDPLILALGKRFLPGNLADARIRVINTDGRLFVKQASERYDVVIIDVPAPATAQLNRFYTVEFLAEVKHVLVRDGIVGFALGQYENYVSHELARMLSSASLAVKQSFRNVLVIPGSRVFFLASDGPLYPDIAARIEQRHVRTKLVNRHYLDGMLTPDRWADLANAAAQPAAINRDFNPILYYYHLRHWMSQFDVQFGLIQVGLLVALGFYLVRLRGSAFVLFASGFAASALEVVLLLAFQVLCGSVYHQVGVIITVFMAGLAVGAFIANRLGDVGFGSVRRPDLREPGEAASSPSPALKGTLSPSEGERERVRGPAPVPRPNSERAAGAGGVSLSALSLAIAGYAVLLPLLLPLLNKLGGSVTSLVLVKVLIAVLTLVLAVLVGMQFPLANRLEFDGTVAGASRLYTADFVGACLGALLACTLLIPLIGVVGVCVVTAGLNVGAAFAGRGRAANG
jgi:spermidine synthase